MVIATTESTVLLLALITLICWGSWANTIKMAGKWRFELFYFDFAAGALLTALIAAFTLGTLGADITFMDNMTIVRKLQLGYAALAGAVFNLGNILLAGAVSLAGMAVAFSIGGGVAMVVGMACEYYVAPHASPGLVGAGCVAMAGSIVAAALSYRLLQQARTLELEHAAEVTGKKAPAAKTAAKGIAISAVGGVLLGFTWPLVRNARQGDLEMGPYPLALLFTGAMFATTMLYNVYFLNLPVQGDAISMFAYFRGTLKQHLVGIAGGVIWCTGTIASLVAAAAPPEILARASSLFFGLAQGAGLLSVLWGLLYWKELVSGSNARIVMWVAAGIFGIGLTLVSLGHGAAPK